MNLRDLQHHFATFLTHGDTFPDADPRGMAVYANNYRSQLLASLREAYGKTRLWLGDAAFDDAAARYVDIHAPSSWTLDAYGASFATRLDALYPEDPEIAELAWLDRTLRCGFVGPDAAPLGLDDLEADDWDRVEFEFVPTLRFRRVRSNAAAIWQAIALAQTPPAVALYDVDAGIRVWRQGFSPRFASITGEPGLAAHQAGALLRSWVDDEMILRLRPG
jgi:hypothetical protein